MSLVIVPSHSRAEILPSWDDHFDESLALRAPGLFRQLVKLMLALPPSSEVKEDS